MRMGTVRRALYGVGIVTLLIAGAQQARAEEMEVSIAYVPAESAEALVIEQPMGRLTLRAWDKPQVKIVATKHAQDAGSLDRLRVSVEIKDGRIRVRTGVRIGEVLKELPPSSGGGHGGKIDLTIDAPRHTQLVARTFAGDLEASGFRAGAELVSSSGEVTARDIEGKVHTNALKGRQRLASIRGDVEADGISGDFELVEVDGQVLVARVVEGQITAREIPHPGGRAALDRGRDCPDWQLAGGRALPAHRAQRRRAPRAAARPLHATRRGARGRGAERVLGGAACGDPAHHALGPARTTDRAARRAAGRAA